MPTVSVVAPDASARADAVVIGVPSSARGPLRAAGAEQIQAALGARLPEALRALRVQGRPDEVVKIATLGLADVPLVVTTGLGEAATSDPAEAARRAAGAALRALT
ncbi:MAG TPA: M17 family peptidase N-terminal domain-containing protein, partial [Jatrophihabitans sp.]|nr:M17 family peptidase N-terminal domain-containing protein [Jatrophihabitans sp.]